MFAQPLAETYQCGFTRPSRSKKAFVGLAIIKLSKSPSCGLVVVSISIERLLQKKVLRLLQRYLIVCKVDTLSTFTKKRRQFTKETMTSQATFLHEFIK
jgi:hypothetical protein